MSGLKIEKGDKAHHFEPVKMMWRANARTLGFFPDGAFGDAFDKGTVLVALALEGLCVGYLLYRTTKTDAAIVHLCVADGHRGKGIAKGLVRRLVETTKQLDGISLRCRADYAANSLWPRLGFSFQREIQGRGRQGEPLYCWWLAHPHPTLFSQAAQQLRECKLCAVIDTNVLLDLREDKAEQDSPSTALRADWLQGTVELCVTDEVFNEISRQKDAAERKRNTAFANSFHCLPTNESRYEKSRRSLRPLFPTPMTDQDRSDLRHIARTIAAEASLFVTRDEDLLEMADEIEGRWGLPILTPTGLITRLDELRRKSEYEPARFAGTTLQMRLISAGDVEHVSTCFHNRHRGERKAVFKSRLSSFLAEPQQYRCAAVFGEQGDPVAVTVTHRPVGRPDELGVDLLRVREGALAPTLGRQMVRQCLVLGRAMTAQITSVKDDLLQQEVEHALFEHGFLRSSKCWVKLSPHVIAPAGEIAKRVTALGSRASLPDNAVKQWAALLGNSDAISVADLASQQEHVLWPAKFTDANIPTYIVPIQPQWAQELFDEGLAKQELFGRKQELALNTEGVYYRSARGQRISAPARILWYVSMGPGRPRAGTKRLRACSRLEEVEIGYPKDLYRKYRHLGVYEWAQVYETAKRQTDRKIMALRFSDTELFDNPVPRDTVLAVLKEEGVVTPLQSPVLAPPAAFQRLYAEAREKERE